MNIFKDRSLLVTGGTGSWGQELATQLLSKYSPKEIRIYSRGEINQVNMRRDFDDNKKLKFIIGDIRDVERLNESTQGVDYIFHLAALKHVPVCEQNIEEVIKTNIIGTKNVISAAIKNRVRKVIHVSTDKCVSPLNFYGTSKSVAEKIIIAANNLATETIFVCIRAGNALGSSGSVVPVFRKQILEANKVTITNGEMTRFFFNLQEAISLLFKASVDSVGGEIFVIKMPAMKIDDLANVMIKELGNKNTKKMIIGERPGEKIHEALVSEDESRRTYKFGKYFMILPMIGIKNIDKKYTKSYLSKLEKIPFGEFISKNTHRMNYKEIKEMLDNENWLDKGDLDKDILSKNKEYLLNYFKKEGWVKGGKI